MPLAGPGELGDVPGEHLPRSGRDQLRHGPGRVAGQPAAFLAPGACSAKDPVHRGDRAQVAALVQQLGIDLDRWQVDEPGRSPATAKIRPAPAAVEPVRRHRRRPPATGAARLRRVAVARGTPVSPAAARVVTPAARSARGRCPSSLPGRGSIPRALGDLLQERVCFSHDPQRRLGPAPTGARPGPARGAAGRSRPAPRRPPDLAHRASSRQHPGVAELAPLGDLGGVQPLRRRYAPPSPLSHGRLVGGQVVELLRRGERPSVGSDPPPGVRVCCIQHPSSRNAVKD